MDFATIGISAVLSALLFIVLEFTIILPLFKKIVTRSVNETVAQNLVPTISAYIDSKVDSMIEILTKSLFQKFTGFLGGRRKGVNSILNRLANGEELEDLQDEYEPSTIEKVLDIVHTISQSLPVQLNGGTNYGNQKEEVHQDQNQDGLQSSSQAFLPSQIERPQ